MLSFAIVFETNSSEMEIDMINKLKYIFDRKEKFKLLGLAFMMLAGSALELLGVAIFTPLVQVLMMPNLEKIEEDKLLATLYTITGSTSIYNFLVVLSGMIIIVYIVKNTFLGFQQNAILSFSYHTRMNLATRLLTTYMKEPYTFHLQKNIAEMQRGLQVDTSQFMILINSTLQLAVEIVLCVVLGVYLFDTSHSITLIVVGLLALCVGIFSTVSKRISTKLGRQNEFYNAKLFQWINQSLGGIKEVKVLHREKFFVETYRGNYKKLIKGAKMNELLAALPKYIVETVSMSGLLIAVIVKIVFGQGNIEVFIPQMAIFAVASMRLLPSVGKINAYINNILYNLPSLDMIYNDLREIENVKDSSFDVDSRNIDKKITFHDKIQIHNITYKYPDGEENVLNNISFEIMKGETIALIGSSGAGKTTLADVVLGLLPPAEGCILVDGENIYTELSAWYQLIGYIPQTIYLSDESIRNNVAFGIPEEEIEDAAIWKALEKAQLKEFVEGLEQGMDTFVGDRGVRLSGGQRQRIGIARALYHDPEILILDEATSALDNETEKAVMESIESLHGKKTMIIIAHRLSTIRQADRIYEVLNGKIESKRKEDIFG